MDAAIAVIHKLGTRKGFAQITPRLKAVNARFQPAPAVCTFRKDKCLSTSTCIFTKKPPPEKDYLNSTAINSSDI